MGQQILLSISILVSGRESTTDKCIASLDRLRRRVPCELILVDTGCPKEMRQWLERRADKVISFQWCNDFAAARNAGIQEASGEWFMFLDDDEWFEDTGGLETFFVTGEYQRYRSASYIIRNYLAMDGLRWQDVPLPRMVRRDRDTKFVYPVHEMLWPRYEPEKQLEDYVHHYGYASSDIEVQMEKHRRNLALLLPAIEEDIHCMHHYLQAVMEYIAMEDFVPALEMAEAGIKQYDSGRENDDIFFSGLCAAAVKIRVLERQYEEAVKRGKELLAHRELSRLARASVDGDLVIAWSALAGEYIVEAKRRQESGTGCQKSAEETGHQEEVRESECQKMVEAGCQKAISCLRKYLQEKEYFSAHSKEVVAQQTLILDQCFEAQHYQMIMGWGFAAALFSQKAEAEVLLQREPIAWWMEAVQNWYTYTSEEFREIWKDSFQALAAKGQQQCIKTQQLYSALIAPAPADEGQDARAEMEALAAKLKIQIRFLIEQHQEQAALAAIRQVLSLLPGDEELLELLKMLEGK